MALSEQEFAAIKEKHGNKRLGRVETAAGEVVCVQPNRSQHSTFMAQIMNEETQTFAYRNLLVSTCVSPDTSTLQNWLEDWPGIGNNKDVIKMLNDLNGTTTSAAGKF